MRGLFRAPLFLGAALLASSLAAQTSELAVPSPHAGHDMSSGEHAGHDMSAMPGHEQHLKMMQAGTTKPPEALEGLKVPDVAVVDQDGKPRRFYSDLIQGKTVALNFVFTTCTTICPPMGANFARLQSLLREGGGPEVFLVSVSVDPSVDTPQRMKEWGAKFGAAPGWTLVTGNRDEIVQLLKALGVYTADKADHSPLVLIGNDGTHRWTRTYGLTAPAKLAELIGEIAGGTALATSPEHAHHGGHE